MTAFAPQDVPAAMLDAAEANWLERADARVAASPREHCAAALAAAISVCEVSTWGPSIVQHNGTVTRTRRLQILTPAEEVRDGG